MMKTSKLFSAIAVIGAFALTATPACAQDVQEEPYAEPDDTWISLNGTVDSVEPDAFFLDYGEGVVKVEMDDWDADADAYKVVQGDQVTVHGIVDDDMFETTTIEANSVYVDGLNSYFYANAADEEDTFVTMVQPLALSQITVQGVVTNVYDEEFTIDTGVREIRVEVEEMPYDPLDEEGFQRVEVGDRVSVTGAIDADFFEGRELVAESIINLERDG